jgi:hypothetical protein
MAKYCSKLKRWPCTNTLAYYVTVPETKKKIIALTIGVNFQLNLAMVNGFLQFLDHELAQCKKFTFVIRVKVWSKQAMHHRAKDTPIPRSDI